MVYLFLLGGAVHARTRVCVCVRACVYARVCVYACVRMYVKLKFKVKPYIVYV